MLTTHSMEEADLLADHIAIMANGHIVAEGTSMELKSRYGVGYTLTLAKQRADDSSRYASIHRSCIHGQRQCMPVGRSFVNLRCDEELVDV